LDRAADTNFKAIIELAFSDDSISKDWSSRYQNKINAVALDSSGLVVVALYAHPVLTGWSTKDSVRAQIAAAHEFVRAHPWWMIARSAKAARQAYASGHNVLVFSLEGAC
jgi:ElaB/YqjD/DUF883 family membrane-anchored ribosome-binding protein